MPNRRTTQGPECGGKPGAADPSDVSRQMLGAVSSTLDAAAAWARENPGRRAVISAAEQTAGRGRLGRVWSSPAGGAWLTLAWPMPDPGAVTLAAADAVCGVIDATLADKPGGGPGARIRWPNDLMLSGRKCGGVLGETSDTDAGRVLLLGVGVNVNNTIPGPVRTPAVSLAEHAGAEIDLPRFVDRLSFALIGVLRGWEQAGFTEALRQRVTDRLWGLGERVVLSGAGETVTGRIVGVEPSGGLAVEVGGKRRTYVSGEISCRGPAGSPREDGVR